MHHCLLQKIWGQAEQKSFWQNWILQTLLNILSTVDCEEAASDVQYEAGLHLLNNVR